MIDINTLRDAIEEAGSIRAAEKLLRSRNIEISDRTIRRRLKEAHSDNYEVEPLPPEFDVDKLIQQRIAEFKQRNSYSKASEWLTVRMKDNLPIGLGFIGDLHLDNDGTDLGMAFEHAELFNGSIEGLYGGFLGDATDNWVGRLKALWANTSISAEQTKAILQRYFEIVRLLFAIGGNHDCLSPEHELLTKRGWIKHTDIQDGDEVLGWDPETHQAKWQPILLVTTRPNTEPMVLSVAGGARFSVTPGHRILYQRRMGRQEDYNNPWQFRTADKLPGYFAVPTAGYSTNEPAPLTNAEIDERVHDFDLPFLLSLDDKQFRWFLQTLVHNFGRWVTKIEGRLLLDNKQQFDALQAGCVAHGWSTRVALGELVVRDFTTTSMTTTRSVKQAAPAAEVWCLTVPMGNFMTRFRGSTHFTGNCWNDGTDILKLLMGDNVDRLTKHQQKVKLVFPNGREVRIMARHTFPGRSQWVTQFGALKAAQLDGSCDIYVAGHTHVSGYSHGWHDGAQRMWHAVQVASYKKLDEYPVELGLPNRDIYCCPVAIIDPGASLSHNLIRWEWDPHEGADRLKWQRKRVAP